MVLWYTVLNYYKKNNNKKHYDNFPANKTSINLVEGNQTLHYTFYMQRLLSMNGTITHTHTHTHIHQGSKFPPVRLPGTSRFSVRQPKTLSPLALWASRF